LYESIVRDFEKCSDIDKTKDTLTTKSIHEREDIQILAQRTKKFKAEFKKPLAKKPKVEGFAKPRIHYKTPPA
jgi:hypothetical protein